MAENKTKPTNASVPKHIAALPNETQRADCRALVSLLGRLTKAKPKMWGPSIVGFGSYNYTYDSGREGDMCVAGFAARGTGLVVYLLASSPEQQARLAKRSESTAWASLACTFADSVTSTRVSLSSSWPAQLLRGSTAMASHGASSRGRM